MKEILALNIAENHINDDNIIYSSRTQKSKGVRKRKMSIKEGAWMLFDMMKTTIQSRLNIFFEKNKKGKAISQQAFSELRDKFDHTVFSSLHAKLTKEEYSGKYNTGTWKNYHLFAIDGAEVQLPRTAKLRLEFGTRVVNKTCPCAGISILYDVITSG